jgi:hypothetical protein
MANNKILILEGASVKRQIILNSTNAVIGRKTPDNEPEISIDDVRVSRQHASLTLRDGKWYVEKGRGASLLLNGQEIAEPTLFSAGDAIIIFDYRLRMLNEGNGFRKKLLLLILLLVVVSFYVFIDYGDEKHSITQSEHSQKSISAIEVDGSILLQKAIDIRNERKAFPENFDRAIDIFDQITHSNCADSIRKIAQVERNSLVQERDSILNEVLLTCRLLKREGRGSDAVKVASDALRYVGKPEEPLRRELLQIVEGQR